ncbi:MAG: NUDIX domain-containing protein [Planctomycetota bacterium]|jgi:mutator protein MutT
MRQISAAVVVPRGIVAKSSEVLMQFKNKGREWEFPGGKLDGSETAPECARRELFEETRIQALELEQLFYIDHQNKFGDKFGCVMFLVTAWTGTPALAEPNKQSVIGWFALDALPKPLTKATQDSIDAGCLEPLCLKPLKGTKNV